MLAKVPTSDVILWCLVLIAGIFVLGAGFWYLRRRLFSPLITGGGEDEWSLQHLRDMRREGRITADEFETLRAKLIAQFRAGSSGRAENADANDAASDDAGAE